MVTLPRMLQGKEETLRSHALSFSLLNRWSRETDGMNVNFSSRVGSAEASSGVKKQRTYGGTRLSSLSFSLTR
jgi:hypothetical protein